jgi:hypothetical protein
VGSTAFAELNSTQKARVAQLLTFGATSAAIVAELRLSGVDISDPAQVEAAVAAVVAAVPAAEVTAVTQAFTQAIVAEVAINGSSVQVAAIARAACLWSRQGCRNRRNQYSRRDRHKHRCGRSISRYWIHPRRNRCGNYRRVDQPFSITRSCRASCRHRIKQWSRNRRSGQRECGDR